MNDTSIFVHVVGTPPINVSIYGTNSDSVNYIINNSDVIISYTPHVLGPHFISLITNDGITNGEAFCVYENNVQVSTQDPINGCDGGIVLSDSNLFSILAIPYNNDSLYYEFPIDNNKLCPGFYYVSIQNITCVDVHDYMNFTIADLVLNYPTVQTNSVNSPNNNCLGEASVVAYGGTPPYSYQWAKMRELLPETTQSIDSLCGYPETYAVKVTDAVGIWVIKYLVVNGGLPLVIPGDTIWATADTCIINIDEAYIYAYTINSNTVDITWAIVQSGIVSYLNQTYDYSITLPGTYNVGLVMGCKSSNILFGILNFETSINEININEIKLYPNPATDYLNLSLNSNIVAFDLMTMSGQKINSYEAKGNQMTINVSNLAEGVYFIRFINIDGSFIVKKFVK
ncbi:MAG: T9SS type A sorting domain-containing protein [Bacteroidota bacterium]